MFYVSLLKKYLGDTKSILHFEGLGVNENISYEEFSFEILDRQVKSLRKKEVLTMKILYRIYLIEGETWEVEANMRSRYPHLFSLKYYINIL